MSSPAATPEQITKAQTLRVAASMLPKSPVWAVVATFMRQRLKTLEDEILNRSDLTAQDVHDRRTQRFYLRQVLSDLRGEFTRAFTSPPDTEDANLQKMDVPPEVSQALDALLAPASRSPVPPSPRPPVAPADPKPIDPFTGQPTS